MADDPNAALRAEYTAALNDIIPKIRGGVDLDETVESDAAQIFLAVVLDNWKRRRNLLQATLAALDSLAGAREALLKDGYPALARLDVPPEIADELKTQQSDISAALSELRGQAQSVAAGIVFSIPTIADKPTV